MFCAKILSYILIGENFEDGVSQEISLSGRFMVLGFLLKFRGG